jgi:hypothetical protein
MALNVNAPKRIYSELMKARRIAPGPFVGSAENLAALRSAIRSAKPAAEAESPNWR